MMRSFVRAGLLAAAAGTVLAIAPVTQASAAVTTTAQPVNAPGEIGARIRWGATGFEASIFDVNPFGQTPTMNPGGAPVWQVGTAYGFLVEFDRATGTLSLSVDFNDDGSYGAGESISRSVFGGATTSYVNFNASSLSITGNEGGSTGRSTLSNLVINGDAQPSLAPAGGFTSQFYGNGGSAFGDITISGELTFTTAGTAQERPSWNITLHSGDVIAAVPEPATLALLGAGLVGLGFARRRRA